MVYFIIKSKGDDHMAKATQNIKYTTVLPVEYVESLKELAGEKAIPSINSGIREAVEQYLIHKKRELYEAQMIEASKDEEFIKRTMEAQSDFDFVDCEVTGEW
jgi:predicted RND superfamily exporter protein